jgi:hypothetical protein
MDVDGDARNEKELRRLLLLHALLVAAMKSKQSVDLEHISTMRNIVGEFEKAYFPDK